MIAVIDIGTNTFHLLIAKIIDDVEYDIVYRESIFVRIAKDGINPISELAIDRALKTLDHFVSVMKSYDINDIRVVATEAIRSASNGDVLVDKAMELWGLPIETISGEEEAKLIFEGTIHAIPTFEAPFLIMDIGGGSVEFIISDGKKILWSESFKLGVQYLFFKYNETDPIAEDEISELNNELEETLKELHFKIKEFKPTRLVGSSGSFETLASLAGLNEREEKFVAIPTSKFDEIFKDIVQSSLKERLANPSIPSDRAELIVIGFLLIQFIMNLFEVEEIVVSDYALREGLLFSKERYGKISM